jgi:hypothetical protein
MEIKVFNFNEMLELKAKTAISESIFLPLSQYRRIISLLTLRYAWMRAD